MMSEMSRPGKGPLRPDPGRCLQPPGAFVPVVDPARCEAKGPCVPACPFGVLAITPLTAEEKSALSLVGKVKALVHGNRRARVAHPDACQACGYCVEVCPERAITLRKHPA